MALAADGPPRPLRSIACTLAFAFLFPCLAQAQPVRFTDPGRNSYKVAANKMGSVFEVTAVHPDADLARAAIDAAYAEIDRIEQLISSWRADSETSLLNRRAGEGPVPLSRELIELIARCHKVSAWTEGAFDISIGPLLPIWDFRTPHPNLPAEETIAAAQALVDYRLISWDLQAGTATLAKPGMRIGFGAIGKGYAANRAVAVLKKAGILGGVVNAGGDMMVFGHNGQGKPWTITIAHPRQPGAALAELEITDQAVVTSGDYERFFLLDGKRYSHIIDPKTGWPVQGVRSTTVICPDAELADGMATALSVMGPAGIALMERWKGFSAILVDDSGAIHATSDIAPHLPARKKENKP